jgi:Amt family ammonium transporter
MADDVAKVEGSLGSGMTGCSIDTGDTTWVLIATVLVLGMMPGLSLFEAGLLRSKNTISIMTQTCGGLIGLSVLW